MAIPSASYSRSFRTFLQIICDQQILIDQLDRVPRWRLCKSIAAQSPEKLRAPHYRMCSAAADLLYLHFVAEDVLIGVALLLCGVEAASQTVGIKQTDDRIWLVSFMDYDLGYFDDETCRLEPLANPFGPKVLPMSPE